MNFGRKKMGLAALSMVAAMAWGAGFPNQYGGHGPMESSRTPKLPKCKRSACPNTATHRRGYCCAECCNQDKIRLKGQMK